MSILNEANPKYDFWKFMHDEHGLLLLDSEIDGIVSYVKDLIKMPRLKRYEEEKPAIGEKCLTFSKNEEGLWYSFQLDYQEEVGFNTSVFPKDVDSYVVFWVNAKELRQFFFNQVVPFEMLRV